MIAFYKQLQQPISADFPYKSKYVEVEGSSMHYIDEGNPNAPHTFLMIHGNPTSSYVWRNIIPYASAQARVIAIDLMGMGQSDKPDIDYTYQDHIRYVEAFIAKLALKNIILVIQDWGSGIGFHYANTHRDNVSGIVFFEAILRPIDWSEANIMERMIFKLFRHPKWGHRLIVKWNFFVERFLPMMAGRKLTREEMDVYRAPYRNEADRKPIHVWPTQIAISGVPEASVRIKQSYADYLPGSTVPKLMFYAKPGMIIKPKEAKELIATWTNLEAIDLGKGKHYLQEQYPHEIGAGIASWYQRTFST